MTNLAMELARGDVRWNWSDSCLVVCWFLYELFRSSELNKAAAWGASVVEVASELDMEMIRSGSDG